MTAHRGDLILLTSEQAREFPIGTLLEDADRTKSASTWWKKGRSTWQNLDDPTNPVRMTGGMVGRLFWVLRGDLPAA